MRGIATSPNSTGQRDVGLEKPWIVPIPGTRKLEHLGTGTVELTADDLRDIDEAASKIKIEGARYPEQLNRPVGR